MAFIAFFKWNYVFHVLCCSQTIKMCRCLCMFTGKHVSVCPPGGRLGQKAFLLPNCFQGRGEIYSHRLSFGVFQVIHDSYVHR